MACEGVHQVNGTASTPMLKSDAATDQESSLVQAIARYIVHTGDASILSEVLVSDNDPAERTIAQRLDMCLSYLGNTSGRTSAQYGLLWGGTRVDWGDVQNCQEPKNGRLCHQQLDYKATISIGVYESAM